MLVHSLETIVQPQMTNMCWPAHGYVVGTSVGVTSGGDIRANRVIVPKTGTLWVGVYIGVRSGNLDIGVYDVAGTTRNRLWSLGSTAMSGMTATAFNEWETTLKVYQGQHLDLAIMCDNATATFGRVTVGAAGQLLFPNAYLPPDTGTGLPKVMWAITGGSLPLPATVLESSMVGSNVYPILGRVA